MSFLSDNTAPVCPEIMQALIDCNTGNASAYGADEWSSRLDAAFSEVFEREVAVFPVVTGTAANAIAMSVICPPYGTVFCHEEAHLEVDECGAAEMFTGGAKLTLVPGAHGKIDAQAFDAALKRYYRSVHMVEPAALSITQATELGTVYRPDEIAILTDIAAKRGLKTHMDGARFANAIAYLGCKPADITWRAGVDILSFGATKNGAMAAEALIFFDKTLIKETEWRRKRVGHLISKMRYVSVQLLACLEGDLWLKNARHANEMASLIAQAAESYLCHPVEGNELFLRLSEEEKIKLRMQNFGFYDWGGPGTQEVRLVTSWNTSKDDVKRFIRSLKQYAFVINS